MQYGALSGQLSSLSNMYCKLPAFLPRPDSSFVFGAEYYPIVRMGHSVFICSPTEGHLGGSQALAVMNEAATHVCAQVSA